MALLTDAFRDSIWQFVGAIIAFLALIGTVLFGILTYRLTRRRKLLTYEVLSATSLARLHEDVAGRVQILFDGQPVRDVTLTLMRITNSGNQPIGSKDFERPVRFSINEEARILSAGVTRTVPERLGACIKYDNSNVTLEPLLLNNGDSVTINILATQFDGEVRVDGRILGVREIEKGQRRISTVQSIRRLWWPLFPAITVLAGVTTIFYFQYTAAHNRMKAFEEGLALQQEQVQAEKSLQRDVDEVKHIVKDSQVSEVLGLYSNPDAYTPAQLGKFWVPSDKGGQAVAQIQETMRILSMRHLRYGPAAKNERFDFVNVQIPLSRDTAYVLTDEEWYLPEQRGPYSLGAIMYGSVTYGATNLRVFGLYALRKQDDAWLILQEGTEKARIRDRQ